MPKKLIRADKKKMDSPIFTLVRHDARSQIVEFEIDRYFGGVDLEPLVWCVNFVNAEGNFDTTYCGKAVFVSDDILHVEWKVPAAVCFEEGMSYFELEGLQEEEDDQHVIWQSARRAIKVIADLNGEPVYDEQTLSEVQRFLVYVGNELPGVLLARDQANEAAVSANDAADKANTAAERADEARESLRDYASELDAVVDDKLAVLSTTGDVQRASISREGAAQMTGIQNLGDTLKTDIGNLGNYQEQRVKNVGDARVGEINDVAQTHKNDIESKGNAWSALVSTQGSNAVNDVISAANTQKQSIATLGETYVTQAQQNANAAGAYADSAELSASTAFNKATDATASATAAEKALNELRAGIASGDFKGEKGDKGDDGYTPIKGVDYNDGYTPVKGVDYFDGETGADGGAYIPSVSADGKLSWTATKAGMPSIADANIKGEPGKDGSDASVTAANIESALGFAPAKTSDITQLNDEIAEKADKSEIPAVPVRGVSVAGTALTPDADGMVEIPNATDTIDGLVKVNSSWRGFGIQTNANNCLYIADAYNSNIDSRESRYNPIVPNNLDYAVKAAMTDGKGAAWTDVEKAAACERMGAEPKKGEWVLKGAIVGDETDRGNIDTGVSVDMSGCTEIIIEGWITAKGGVMLSISPPHSGVANGVGYNGTRYSKILIIESGRGLSTLYAKHKNLKAPAYVSESLTTYDYLNIKPRDIVRFLFESSYAVNVIACEYKIYAR